LKVTVGKLGNVCLAFIIASIISSVIALTIAGVTPWLTELLMPLGLSRHVVLAIIGNVLILLLIVYVVALMRIAIKVKTFRDAFYYALYAIPGLNIYLYRTGKFASGPNQK
jgi:hypothetical protein